MPRLARQLSGSKIYHIVFRGINKQNIFKDDKDYNKILEKLVSLKEEMNFEIYAYCLMSNHMHILIKEKNWGDISLIMKRLLVTYAIYFNKKYQRIGKLINDRYLSIPVKNDAYILNLIRYIHQNPVKIGLPLNYKWSSFNAYFDNNNKLVDTKFILSLISKKDFLTFNYINETEIFEPTDKLTKPDYEIKKEILDTYNIKSDEISSLEKQERNKLLTSLCQSYSVSQLSRITGIPQSTITRCNKSI